MSVDEPLPGTGNQHDINADATLAVAKPGRES